MTRALFIAILLLPSLASAGDEFLTPKLEAHSAYESADPSYKVVGLEVRETEQRLYVVADPPQVLAQQKVNRIIRDARRRNPGITSIMFYSSVHNEPVYPAFAIYEHLAVYVVKDNKTYFGTAAKSLYGGWAHGPVGRLETSQ